MRLLFDVLHPAHVHFFRPLAEHVQDSGGEVLFTAREKDVTRTLLEAYDFPYEVLTKIHGGKIGLVREMAERTAKLALRSVTFKPDLYLGIMGPVIAPLGRALRIPSWVFYDTETAKLTNWYAYRMAQRVYVPDSYIGWTPSNKTTRYAGFHELAYLHPSRFQVDPSIRDEAGLQPDEPFALVRIVSWEASHDIGDTGFSDPVAYVKHLQKTMRVIVSGERGVPEEIRDLAMTIPPHRIHHLLAEAELVVGEGATMCVEAALLGTPSILVHTAVLGYVLELERIGLLKLARNQQQALDFTDAILEDLEGAKENWHERRADMLEHKIDVSGWLIKEVENFLRT